MHERATQSPLIEPHRDLIGKPGEDAALDRAGFRFVVGNIEPFRARDADELLPQLRRFARGGGVD